LISTGYQNCTTCVNGSIIVQILTNNSLGQSVYTPTCQPCIANCAYCTVATTCAQCQPGFYNTSNSCLPCQTPYCNTCNNSGLTCVTCVQGAYINSSSGQCSLCAYAVNNCVSCNMNGSVVTCYRCKTGFFANNGSTQCQKCPENCADCNEFNGTVNCDNCNPYYNSNSSNICVLCGEGCLQCY